MELATAIKLIEKGVSRMTRPQRWADFGAGDGLFSRALASLIEAESTVYAVDKNSPVKIIGPEGIEIIQQQKDFIKHDTGLSDLDGIIMANSLHYAEEKLPLLKKLTRLIKPEGRMIIVEYDSMVANQWVPYPAGFIQLCELARKAGLGSIEKLAAHPSKYHKADIYAALLMIK